MKTKLADGQKKYCLTSKQNEDGAFIHRRHGRHDSTVFFVQV